MPNELSSDSSAILCFFNAENSPSNHKAESILPIALLFGAVLVDNRAIYILAAAF
jgi:hypothetical protein